MVSLTKVANSVAVLVVELESYWKLTPNIINVVSASTITGVIDATLNLLKSLTSCVFCVSDKSKPVLLFIEIKTFPYSGVDETPLETSKLPSSPPHTDTACVFEIIFLHILYNPQ